MIIYPIVYYLATFDHTNATLYYEGAGKQVKRSHNAIPFPTPELAKQWASEMYTEPQFFSVMKRNEFGEVYKIADSVNDI